MVGCVLCFLEKSHPFANMVSPYGVLIVLGSLQSDILSGFVLSDPLCINYHGLSTAVITPLCIRVPKL